MHFDNNIISIKEKLASIDWNFSDIKTADDLNSIHPYPAKFIPQIPRTLIKEIKVPSGTSILDPFCGSGTTLTEAQSLGIPSVGIDLNPIACLISRVKTQPFPPMFQESAEKCVQRAMTSRNYVIPEIPNLNHWFKVDIQHALASLLHEIRSVNDNLIREALQLAFSSIIVRVSNQESDTRYAAIEKNIESKDVFNLFLSACKHITKVKSENPSRYLAPVTVLQKMFLLLQIVTLTSVLV